ncbi:hypothetical protein BOTCAL_0014g00240 [Botryotinia calthae]|uniref:Uncharacterized protein n=1 Tax=Botryotinia calthae TaxID=38488 RepID=A0A4Y8DI15_9HELO|nr:hypothetical protein BOTCAL_0014g00240 [Botryotinia calthae]
MTFFSGGAIYNNPGSNQLPPTGIKSNVVVSIAMSAATSAIFHDRTWLCSCSSGSQGFLLSREEQ